MTFEQELLIKENKAREEGRAEGREEGREEIIWLLHKHGKPAEVIAKDTGLSEAEVISVLEKMPETMS